MASAAIDPTGGNPTPEENGTPKKKVACEFCESTIAPSSGDVIKLSDKAKGFRDLETENKKLKDELAEEKRQHEQTKARLEHDPPAPSTYGGEERRKSQRIHFRERRKAS
jgi:hypothetical protein